jgi:NO-binding membrane sensor protein with MHYT domain/nitrogen-specific signal transduction histidine kinase
LKSLDSRAGDERLPGHFDLWTVLVSFVIASLAGFVAFESIDHTRYSKAPALWTFVGGLSLGVGIWSMHFIGMMAWVPPYPLYYSLTPTLLSIVAAVAASWLAMHLTVGDQAGAPRRHLLLGAALVGTGICAMHYLGMAALHFSEPVQWSIPGVLLSYLIACAASFGAMVMLAQGGAASFNIGRQLAASAIIGVAICGMHYTGMLAMMVSPTSVSLSHGLSFSGPELARAGVGNSLLFTLCLLVVFYRDKVHMVRTASEEHFRAKEAGREVVRLGAAGKLAASVAHEISNPLEAVTNLLLRVEKGQVGKDELGFLKLAQEELKRISDITTHTLKFYRQPSAPAETDLVALMESALAIFTRRASERGIAIERMMDYAAPHVLCREGEIRQVFANLIGNAIAAMQPGGVLFLEVRSHDGGVQAVIADTGEGIGEEARSRLFEPFFTSREVSGTGLGLSICADIVQRHGGSLNFTSNTTPGVSGTRFFVYLATRPQQMLIALQGAGLQPAAS